MIRAGLPQLMGQMGRAKSYSERLFEFILADRLIPQEKRYMRAMAELGAGPHRSGDIAEKMKREVTSIGTIRNVLIPKGIIYSPTYGETAFTGPLFSDFMKGIMPVFN